jgi:hypothetical protein
VKIRAFISFESDPGETAFFEWIFPHKKGFLFFSWYLCGRLGNLSSQEKKGFGFLYVALMPPTMKEFWNLRYAESEFAYGTEPNLFFRESIQNLPVGKILFPAEGEGRNAVYAATLCWEVVAFDQSEAGKEKAMMLSSQKGVDLTYEVCSLEQFQAEESSFDCLVLIFAHFPAHLRKGFHRKLGSFLKPGGTLILEGFSKNHIRFNSVNEKAGGPKDPTMLFSKDELEDDFSGFSIGLLEEVETELEEGLYHVGKSSVIRMLAVKK